MIAGCWTSSEKKTSDVKSMTALTIETKLGEMRSDKKKIKIVVSPYAAKIVERKGKSIHANALTITAITSL